MTAKEIVYKWVKTKEIFPTHEVSTRVFHFGQIHYNKTFSPATYTRKFRELKQERHIVKEFHKKDSREKWYKVL